MQEQGNYVSAPHHECEPLQVHIQSTVSNDLYFANGMITSSIQEATFSSIKDSQELKTIDERIITSEEKYHYTNLTPERANRTQGQIK